MAIFNCSFSITDDAGARQTFNVPIPQGSLTLADVTGYMEDLAALLDPVCDGTILSMGFQTDVSVPGGLGTATADSSVQKGALFTFAANGTPYRYGIRVPAFAESKITGGNIDTVDADVAAFINALTAGLTPVATLVSPSDPYENDLTTLSASKLSFRK